MIYMFHFLKQNKIILNKLQKIKKGQIYLQLFGRNSTHKHKLNNVTPKGGVAWGTMIPRTLASDARGLIKINCVII